jgi:tight adherence protein C
MNNPLTVTALFLIPIFLLLNDDFSLERASIKSIHRIGDRTSVRAKLAELGRFKEQDYENFRYKQLIISSLFAFCIILFGILRDTSLVSIISLLVLTFSATIYLLERSLSRRVRNYRLGIEEEFPAIVEMLTLSLSAGESPLSAIQRISSRGSGALVSQFEQVVVEVSQGAPFEEALDSLGRRLQSMSVRRFIDSIVVAISRGTPLVEILQSHAQEAQSLQRNRITSLAAKAEMSMMIPVVFLILPISILFALWPSLTNLNLFAQG